MIPKTITEYCTGCRACEQLCSHKAIQILPDKEGFLTAFVDSNSCIDCKLCERRCPQNQAAKKYKTNKAFAIRLKDDAVLKNSASGGAFAGFSKECMENGGHVAGVVYDEIWSAVFQLTDDVSEVEKMQSSKYLQADTKQVFGQIKMTLQNGQFVLFFGTPCQVAGLNSFLNKTYDNLITVDLICHGVTSPLMFKEYIKWLEKEKHSRVMFYNFRSKEKGWGLNYTYKLDKKTITAPFYLDPYYKVFLSGDAYRECCYRCNYSSFDRISDITIGDYWGINEEHPSFFSSKGVSSVLINTEKGSRFFDGAKKHFYILESSIDKIANNNENLLHPTPRNSAIRNSIYEGINIDPLWFEKIAKSYGPSIISYIKASIPSWIRKIIKNR